MVLDNDGHIPFRTAANVGNKEAVGYLVTKSKCPVDCVANSGYSPLHYAAMEGDLDLVRLLVSELWANTQACNKLKETPVHVAAKNGNIEMVMFLVNEFGCSVHLNDKNVNNSTPSSLFKWSFRAGGKVD